MIKRVLLIVLDSVGIGELPDAEKYGDTGSNTLGNIAATVGLKLPNMQNMGLGNIAPLHGIEPVTQPTAAFGKMAELSPGKDTTTGHWEIAGIILEKPFPTYPHGFPPEIIEEFERKTGRKVLGNKVASGTEIIGELGEEHLKTGRPIVYTSADSVFQIAAHEDIIPLTELYEMCKAARAILQGDHAVGRVIARPFIGSPGNFQRTANRHDYSLAPPSPTVLELIRNSGLEVVGVGKINDIYAGKGITRSVSIKHNMDGVDRTIEVFQEVASGLVFTNLVDYDSKYGHRNDPVGYAKALEEFDGRLPEILSVLDQEDVLIITADHGCDPTTPSTDHSREYVPLLIHGAKIKVGVNLGIRKSFADLGATVTDMLGVAPPPHGVSMYKLIALQEVSNA
ncbi:phosphopentomutase [Zhaonella formicivorans]|uniref:phosphopentomutase n=1 Tax=Zhaonella formicivorans TaxID=2528593 RepID=UPI001D117A80|nr:phosphopentomutase [Zhaonella formicivorans]